MNMTSNMNEDNQNKEDDPKHKNPTSIRGLTLVELNHPCFRMLLCNIRCVVVV